MTTSYPEAKPYTQMFMKRTLSCQHRSTTLALIQSPGTLNSRYSENNACLCFRMTAD